MDIRLFYQREGKHQVYRYKEEEPPSAMLSDSSSYSLAALCSSSGSPTTNRCHTEQLSNLRSQQSRRLYLDG
jgi:hypothetical protein